MKIHSIVVGATLRDVLEHYDAFFKLGLSEREKTELTECLKSQ